MGTTKQLTAQVSAWTRYESAVSRYQSELAEREGLTPEAAVDVGITNAGQAQTNLENAVSELRLATDGVLAAKCDSEDADEAVATYKDAQGRSDELRVKLDDLRPTTRVSEEPK